MNDEEALLAALAADPFDDVTRLVYADWLDEQGEEPKARYLRLERRLAAIVPGRVAKRLKEDRGHQLLSRLRAGLDPSWLARAGWPYDVLFREAALLTYAWRFYAESVLRETPGSSTERFRLLAHTTLAAAFPWPRAEALRARLCERPLSLAKIGQGRWAGTKDVVVRLSPA